MALQAAEVPEGPHVVTSGTASVDATPDIATTAIEVSVSSKDAAQAKKQVDERVAQYFDFLQKNNIEKKDISAANLRTQPEYDYLKTGESVLKGYRAVRRAGDPASVGQAERAAGRRAEIWPERDPRGGAGCRQTGCVSRAGAAKSDRERDSAGRIPAKGFHAKLGPVYSIRYRVANYQPMPVARMYKAAGAAAESDAAQTYEQQSIHFDDQVDVVFELQRNAAQ